MSIFIISKYYSGVISRAPFIIDKNKKKREREREKKKRGVGNNKAGECPIIMASKLGYVPESVTFA